MDDTTQRLKVLRAEVDRLNYICGGGLIVDRVPGPSYGEFGTGQAGLKAAQRMRDLMESVYVDARIAQAEGRI